ncbi:MAG: DUF1688 family protein [Burkholderiaceae bacterium]
MNTGPGGGATTLSAVDTLRSPATIRERCENIATAIEAGGSPFFTLDPSRLDALAQRVLETMRSHARRNHAPDDARWLGLDAGGVDRMGDLSSRLADAIPAEQTRARVDLAIAVALLDASAGPTWHYEEGASGQCFESTEGLAVAGFRAFMAGVLSSRSDEPLRSMATRWHGSTPIRWRTCSRRMPTIRCPISRSVPPRCAVRAKR